MFIVNELSKPVRKVYERVAKSISDDDTRLERSAICVMEVINAHFLIADYFYDLGTGIGGFGPRDINLLKSAIDRQYVGYGGQQKWKDGLEICATLFYGLIKNHAFHDSNKRTAFLVLLYQLEIKLGRRPNVPASEFEKLTVNVAAGNLEKHYRQYSKIKKRNKGFHQVDITVLFLADYIRRKTDKIDKRTYMVTYQQMNAILKKTRNKNGFTHELRNPHRNFIDLVRIEQAGIFKKYEKEVFLKQVGFPSWKKEMSKKDIKTIRTETELTPEKGYDSNVVFKNGNPLHHLISIYDAPLKRLADR